ncbi:30S ribosomal protein S3, partial [Patescibacteria group bacterium]|nr:30S ribosomal protein S3 [Patescibacteria group bacterium]
SLSAQWVAQQLQRRMPHRRVMKQAIGKIMANKEILGAKVAVAGRLGGAEIARSEWLKEGRLPLQTIRSNIDYALVEAQTSYGTVGVKVWMFKGETFE